jgi:hypothetical protein
MDVLVSCFGMIIWCRGRVSDPPDSRTMKGLVMLVNQGRLPATIRF